MTSYTKTMMESLAEVRGLQENNMDLMRKAAGGAMQTLKMKDGKLQMDSFTASAIMQVFDKVNPANQKKMEQMINDGKKSGIIKLQKFAMSKVNAEYSEELELDEGGMKRQLMKVSDFITTLINQGGMDKSDYEAARGYVEDGDMKGLAYMVNKLDTEPRDMIINAVAKGMGKKEAEKIFKVRILRVEEVEVDAGKMKELHGYIQDGKSAKEIAKIMKLDVKTIKALMSGYNEAYELGTDEYREYLEKLTPGEMDEASARADAMRGMRRGREVDPADVDTDATDDDIKGASKNIIMQMRKAVSLRGNFPVEFGDGKKVKIPAKVGQAVQDKYNSLKKPADKEKFQAQVAKSYKDMLKVLKAGYMMKAAYEEIELDEAKYDLYHKDFSSAMQHAYKMAKKLHGITVDPKEIDDKVASGPRKPSEGKTNSYRLGGDKGAIQVQVYNKGGSKPYELNFYKEEVELDESVIDKVKEIASKKKAMKIDGVMVDSFTASAISQIYDKVNDANKKKMEKLPITNLANLAFKMMQKNEYVPEEVELDEALPSHLKKFFDKDGNPKSKEGKAAWERLAKMKGFKKYTSKQVKMAIGIAFDKRYVQGNMTGAVNAIEKIAKGLSEIEPVANALRRANENTILGRIDAKLKERKNG